jgi:hypothetical protein
MARNVSIHVHLFTSETIVELVGKVVRRGHYDIISINVAANNKEFAFALRAA